jgi:hypothetical protein
MNEQLINLLKILEWSGGKSQGICPICLRHCDIGHHADDCDLKAALEVLREEQSAVEELAKLHRVMELTDIVLPEDIDESEYEYAMLSRTNSTGWPEFWEDTAWTEFAEYIPATDARLLCRRRRQKNRIVPTDADSIAVPRRPCLVRDFDDGDHIPFRAKVGDEKIWKKAQLLAVLQDEEFPFLVLIQGKEDRYRFCEIEVKK